MVCTGAVTAGSLHRHRSNIMIVPMNNHHTISSSNMVTLTMIATGIRAGMITIRGTDSRFHQTVNVTKSDHFPKASAYVLAFFMGF